MKDNYGREIHYLRISVTQRCNLNCAYCGAAKPDAGELSPADFARLAAGFAAVGIDKIRLTGGEPLVRDDICEITRLVKAAAAPKTLGVTTNGLLLAEKAEELLLSGVNAVNVSLDSLDRSCYRQLTGRDALTPVLDGIEKALSLGFRRVRINAVLLRGVNEKGADRLIELAKDMPLDVRFIELMPFSDVGESERMRIRSDEILARFPFLLPTGETDGTAVYYAAPGFKGKIGMISPISKKFCNACNRVRLLCNGRVKPCLGHPETYDLMPYIDDPEQLETAIREAILKKPAGHHFETDKNHTHALNRIGG
ncbi:MAG: GTP 3',8-cyclase MoaA [Clostridia bacterium]|nr:GTP 3',8-cyclase MoaA [Clostridia bacterium]